MDWEQGSVTENGSGWTLSHDLANTCIFSASAENEEVEGDCWNVPRRSHSHEML